MRILAQPHGGRCDPNPRHQGHGARLRFRLADVAVPAQHFRELRADRIRRVEARHRLLKNHRHAVAADLLHLPVAIGLDVFSGKNDFLGMAVAVARQQIHNGQRGHRFAAARFPDNAMGLALMDGKMRMAHRLGGAKAHGQSFDFKDRAHLITCVPKARRSPSPTRLIPSTKVNRANPGIIITHALKNM